MTHLQHQACRVTTILTHHKSWRAAPLTKRAPDLTDAECEAVRRALRFLRTRLGGGRQLAVALGMTPGALSVAMTRSRRPGAALALRLARVAKVPIDAILLGDFSAIGACPHCGRA
jgi:hypothetical protein